ncbi:MAG: efflux RND transporter permease subunit [Pseudomonadota bacterium]
MSRDRTARGPIAWMAQNSVAANLLMAALLVSGIIAIYQIQKEVFPDVQIDVVAIDVAYPGAGPEEVERGILLAIEEQVRDLEGIKRLDSVASEGGGTVMIELQNGVSREKALMDVKNAVDRIRTFPLEAEKPLVAMAEHKHGVLDLVLYGDIDEWTLRRLAEDVRDRLLQLDGVSMVDLVGAKPLEISIEVSQEVLRRHDLTLDVIADQIRRTALEKPGGGVKTPSGEVLLRMNERRYLGSEFAQIPILFGANGRPVPLGELADIRDGFSPDDERYARFNGKPAILLSVYSPGTESPADVARTVRTFADELQRELPASVRTAVWNDRAQYFEGRLNLLLKNAGIGLVLVLLVLGLLLEPKLAFWVAMGIPIAFLGSFSLLLLFDISLNMISMFAFMVTLGMVVDDAIVVGENIFHLRKQGMSAINASIRGAQQMAVPIFFSIATTMAAFAPLMFIPGRIGKIQFAIPVIVMLVLAISLLESFFILPTHLAHTRMMPGNGSAGRVLELQRRISASLDGFIERTYRPLLVRAVRHRAVTLVLSLAILLSVVGLLTGGHIKYIDFPGGDRDEVETQAVLPYGVDVTSTEDVMQRLIASARRAIDRMGGESVSLGILSTIGIGRHEAKVGSHITSVTVLLVPLDQRSFSSKAFAEAWREELGPMTGLESLGFSSTRHGLNRPIDFVIAHSDTSVLERAAREITKQLGAYAGAKDVDDGIAEGKPQWNFTLTDEGANAGLSVAEIGEQLRSAFYGAEALRQQRGRNEIKVMVRLPKAERQSLESVNSLLLRTPDNGEIPLMQAAEVRTGFAYKSIERTDGRRTLRIQADVDERLANAQEIEQNLFAEILPTLQQRFPGLEYGLRGRAEEFKGFRDFLLLGVFIALIAIYALIAIPLRNYTQPLLVVMAAIPFGFVGSVMAHFVLGMPLSMFSLMGLLALGGVVVNDSIVYVTTANNNVATGMPVFDAAVEAACRRFRPILLTTVTTFFGLSPILFESSPEAQMMIPMAVSLSFGILVSTFFVLLLVPALFVYVEHLRRPESRDVALASQTPTPGVLS